MTLTVRLDATLAAALERYCAERGATKSLVVQESLASYLLAHSGGDGQPAAGATKRHAAPVASANYVALVRSGLLGAVAGEGQSATKPVVRTQLARRLAHGKLSSVSGA